MAKKEINPNADKEFIDQVDLAVENNFPKFLKAIKFSPFRHINELTITFIHPICVIAGTSRRLIGHTIALTSLVKKK